MKILLTACFILFFQQSFADIIDDGRRQYYGAIVYIDKEKVILKEGCGETRRTFRWSEGISIIFNLTCDHPGWDMSRSPVTEEENCSKRKVFRFYIKGSRQVSYADIFFADKQTLTITYVNNQGTKTVSLNDIERYIEWVVYTDYCEKDIPSVPAKL